MNLAKTIHKLYVVYCCMLSKCFPDHKASGPHQSFKEGEVGGGIDVLSTILCPTKPEKNEKFQPIAIPLILIFDRTRHCTDLPEQFMNPEECIN